MPLVSCGIYTELGTILAGAVAALGEPWWPVAKSTNALIRVNVITAATRYSLPPV